MKKFKKVLSVLTAIAMLLSSGLMAFAEDQIEETAPVVEETPVAEESVQEEPAVEAPVQEAAPVVEETPVQEAAPAVEKAPVQDAAPVVEETPVQEAVPTVEEAPVQEAAPAVEEAPVQEAAPVVEEAPVQEAAPAVEETPVQEETPAVEETPAQEEAPAQEEPAQEAETDPVPSYNNEETPAEGENTAEETTADPAATEPEAEKPEGEDTKKDENEDDEDIVIIGDEWGYVDPEIVSEYIPDITAEMKYPEAEELKLNESVSGTVDSENEAVYFIRCGSNKTIVLGLTASDEAIDVTINDQNVSFAKVEGSDSTGFCGTYTMNVQAGTEYIISLTSSYPVSYTLTAEDAYKAEAPAEETTEEVTPAAPAAETVEAENAEANNEEEPAGETEEETTETENEGNETTGEENNFEETTEEEEITEEEQAPAMTGWITVDAESFEIGATVTLTANSDVELENMVAWQTKVQNENGESEWKTAGYGNTLAVELTEENTSSSYRFRMEDGSYSEEYTLTANEAAGEETEETEEETAETEEEPEAEMEENEEATETEGIETAEETEEAADAEETEETEQTEAEQMIALGCTKVIVTAEEGADLYAEANKESEVTGHLETEAEAWVTLNEEGTWGQLYSADEEAAMQFISMEDAEIAVIEAETEEETEEVEETEKAPLTDEELIELGYRKVQVLNKNGVDLYAGTEEDADVIGHIDFEEELWIKDAEAEGWAEIYTEEEEETKFVKLADIDKQPLTDEELIELGYRKVQVVNEEGVDFYASADEKAEVIGHSDFDEELWIKDTEIEGWVEVYTEEKEEAEEGIKQFAKLEEILKLSDAKMLEMGYIKVYVAIDIGANVYESPFAPEGEDKEEKPVDHLDVNAELWVKLVENAERALIYNPDERASKRYISLVDIIAILKPAGMEELPTRELSIISSIDGMEIVYVGTIIELETKLTNFLEDDHYTVQWKYSEDGETFVEIEDANDLTFEYELSMDNAAYIWRVSVVLVTAEE